MRRIRVKLIGFGLAALAGSAHAADDEWRAAPPPAVAPPTIIPAGGVPAQFPSAVQNRPPSQQAVDPDEPIWLPARSALRPATGITPPPVAVVPVQYPEPVSARPLPARRFLRRAGFAGIESPAFGPRVGSVPAVPTVPEQLRVNLDAIVAAQQPAPAPRELPLPRPTAPATNAPGYLPDMAQNETPGACAPPAGAAGPNECPVAPPELMVPPDVALTRKRGFGSEAMHFASDYPTLSELRDTPVQRLTRLREPAGPPRGFVQGEYLLWWANNFNVPILGTTNTQGGFGFLGEPGSAAILGPGPIIGSLRQGFRTRAGLWLDDCGSCAIDGSFFFLGRRTADLVRNSGEFPIITRPIFSPNVQNGVPIGETGQAVAVPGVLAGSLSAHAESVIWGFDANIRKCLFTTCSSQAMWFVGYRNVNLSESLSITENITVVGDGGGQVLLNDPIGTTVLVQDRFATDNHFNGGQIGATYGRQWGRFSLDGRASIAFGVTHQELDISGFQTRTRPGQLPVTFRGGLLAAGPNLGSFSRDSFSIVPEVTINAGYWVTPALKVYVGYNFLFWSNVIRPGNQIDPVVDLSVVPNAPAVPPAGQNHPAPLFRQSDLWLTGLQFGLQWQW